MTEKRIPRITDGEFRILEVLYTNGPMPAGSISTLLLKRGGWSRNTTYTFITRLVNKGAIIRTEPRFMCTPAFSRDEIVVNETQAFLEKLYQGSFSKLVEQFTKGNILEKKELDAAKKLIGK